MTRLVLISDTHNQLDKINIPLGDILIHTGDATGMGSQQEVEQFAKDFAKLPHRYKIFIAGNHDWLFARNRSLAEEVLRRAGDIIYLQDSETTVAGLRIYGSPWQPEFYNWAFNVPRGQQLREIWKKIPTGIDVLATHGPAYGTLDLTMDGRHVGCEELAEELKRIRPRVHACGHIHFAYGKETKDGIISVNASNLDESYRVAHRPIVVDL